MFVSYFSYFFNIILAPIDIQSILNGAAKFCKHCDVVILNNMIKRKVSDLPFLAKDSELLSDGEELYFCSSTCYMQFALMHRSPSISEDKVRFDYKLILKNIFYLSLTSACKYNYKLCWFNITAHFVTFFKFSNKKIIGSCDHWPLVTEGSQVQKTFHGIIWK